MYLQKKKKKMLGKNDPSRQSSSSADLIAMEINEETLILLILKETT